MFYWLTIMFSQTLGTALGDWTADTAGLGYRGGAMVFSALLALVVAAYYWTKLSRTLLFWAAFVLNGDGATPLPTVLSWPTLAVIVVAAAATMSLAVSVTLRRRSRIYRKDRPSAVVT